MERKMTYKRVIALLLTLTMSLFCFAGCSSGGTKQSLFSKEAAEYMYDGGNGYCNIYIKAASLIKYNNTVFVSGNIYQKCDEEFVSYLMKEIADTNFYFGVSEGEKTFDNLDYDTGYASNSLDFNTTTLEKYVKQKYPATDPGYEVTGYFYISVAESNMTSELFDELKAANDLTAIQISVFNNDLSMYLHVYPDEFIDLDAQ